MLPGGRVVSRSAISGRQGRRDASNHNNFNGAAFFGGEDRDPGPVLYVITLRRRRAGRGKHGEPPEALEDIDNALLIPFYTIGSISRIERHAVRRNKKGPPGATPV